MSPDWIGDLQRCLVGGDEHLLERIPNLIALSIEKKLWAERCDKDGVAFTSFEAFANYKLYWGLNHSIDDILAFCRKRSDVYAMVKAEVGALRGPGGAIGNQNAVKKAAENEADNISFDFSAQGSESPAHGTGAIYTLRRLKRDNPELAQRVVKGELSANAAAIEAGLRLKVVSLPIDPQKASIVLLKHFNGVDLEKLLFFLRQAQPP